VIEDILLYHVVAGVQDSAAVIVEDGGSLATLLGTSIGVAVPDLVDAAKDFPDPSLILDRLDDYAVNGIVHAIDGVLLPVDLDASTGIFVGTDSSEKIKGTKGDDLINAKDGNDKIRAGNGNDIVLGGDGKDNINGASGDDALLGGSGDDKLKGASGDDDITGGLGHDMMWGGGGNDTFFFAVGDGKDMIRGFTDDDAIVIYAESYEVTELKGNTWLLTYGETDSILIKGNAKVDIEDQVDLLMA
jgi:Ca2+-binding RTX toxin-like protein